MATKEFWIQIENHAWDMNPHNINRMTGESIAETDKVPKTLISPETLVTRTVKMTDPVHGEALILRRYTENWAQPDDRKVNPWDLNEPDPTDNGTMGTIPGPTIECNVGDDVIVHFRNKDNRATSTTIKIPVFTGGFPPTIDFREFTVSIPLPVNERTHSLHPHGIVFAPEHDGAYPLSPPDLSQPIPPAEAAAWTGVGVTGNKMGDRVPPGGTFTYRWNTFGWPSTAGVWLYHDHSICDHHNVTLGAIGILVIHNPADEDDVLEQDLPGGNWNGRLTRWCILRPSLEDIRLPATGLQRVSPSLLEELKADLANCEKERPDFDQLFSLENGVVEAQLDRAAITAFLRRCYVSPPKNALYLQLYHEMHFPSKTSVAMAINGRRFLGNTPTLIGGLDTKMRFGLVAMNNTTFHTFHLHGHRWVVPGPSGGKVGGDVPPPGTGVQVSPLNQGVSQFEDTKIFGPANSFSFTINQGSFMGPPLGGGAKGEWHMHCHVLHHMMTGMMGSLLVIEGGDLEVELPRGTKCPTDETPDNGGDGNGDGAPMTATVRGTGACVWADDVSGTPETTIKVNGTVTWTDEGCSPHTVVSDNVPPFDTLSPPLNLTTLPATRQFTSVGDFGYHCGIHGGDPVAQTPGTMWGIINVVP